MPRIRSLIGSCILVNVVIRWCACGKAVYVRNGIVVQDLLATALVQIGEKGDAGQSSGFHQECL